MEAWVGTVLVLMVASVLDYGIGDPRSWLHPVQVMGWAIAQYQTLVLNGLTEPLALRWAGVVLGLSLVGGSGAGCWLVLAALDADWMPIHSAVGMGLESILFASCLSGRSLRRAAEEVLTALEEGVDAARQRLSWYVGRDTTHLTQPEILRAVLETVSENATDGVTAPLFYGILGSALGLGPVPLALAYKAASTLDSMVGYREPPYADLGWFSARLEDGLTWVPCRLTVLSVALLSRQPEKVLGICRRDAIADPSPNAGWSECAYATALGVQLGGTNVYRGVIKEKPLLGHPDRPITPAVIHQALRLTRHIVLLWLGVAIPVLWACSVGQSMLIPNV